MHKYDYILLALVALMLAVGFMISPVVRLAETGSGRPRTSTCPASSETSPCCRKSIFRHTEEANSMRSVSRKAIGLLGEVLLRVALLMALITMARQTSSR